MNKKSLKSKCPIGEATLRASIKAGYAALTLGLIILCVNGYQPGEMVSIGVRAESIVVTHEQSDDAMPAEVGVVEPLGSHLLLTLTLGSQIVKVATRTDFQVKPRDRVWLRPEAGSLRLLGRADAA